MTRLESAIAVGKPEMADLIVDVRKNEMMSSIPWLDRFLSKLELAPRIRRFLYQANVKWTVGELSLFCGVCFVSPGVSRILAHRTRLSWLHHRPCHRRRTNLLCLSEAQDAPGQVRAGHPGSARTDRQRASRRTQS